MATDTSKITGAADELSAGLAKGGSAARTLGAEIANAIKSLDARVTAIEGGGETQPPIPPSTGANDVSAVMYNHVGAPCRTDQYKEPWGKHEAPLHGAPASYDWAAGAKPSSWMNMASHTTPWGQVFESAAESPVTNVRIHVRNHLIYALVNGTWKLLAHSEQAGIGGGNFNEDFTGGAGGSVLRQEGPGQVSFNMMPGQLYHWWLNNWPRTAIPAGTTAFYTSCEMRLIPNTDPNVNLANAKYLGACSSDYYPSGTATATIAPGMSIPRHRWITPEWKIFSSYIGGPVPTSEAQYRSTILANPLPPGVVA